MRAPGALFCKPNTNIEIPENRTVVKIRRGQFVTRPGQIGAGHIGGLFPPVQELSQYDLMVVT